MKKAVENLIIFLPAPAIIFFVYKFGIKIPFWDQWELVTLLEKLHNHTLTLGDLWLQHNEHRIIFPQIVMLILARLSGWNIFLELCTNVALAIFILLFLLSILKNTFGETSFLMRVFISLLIFSLVQYENWSWGWQIHIFMSVFGVVISIWAVNKWQGKTAGLITAISGAVLSSYSFCSGLMVWPALLFVMLLENKWKLKHIMIMIFACIGTVLLYFHNFKTVGHHPPVLFFISYPFVYVRYVLTYLGASLASNHWFFYFSPMIGVIFLALISLAIVRIWKFDRQKLCNLAPWIALALYACMAACVTGVGRAGFGCNQALESRYTTISSLLPVSTAVLLFQSLKPRHSVSRKRFFINRFISAALITVFSTLYVMDYGEGFYMMKIRKAYIYESAFCLNNPQNCDATLLGRLYPEPDIVRKRAQTLIDMGIRFKDTGVYSYK